MLALLIIMEFNFYDKIKLVLSYIHYGYIEKDTTAIRKPCNQNNHQAVFGVCS